MSEKSTEGNESGGFLTSFTSSLKAHVDERLKSPFAGAFLFAWVYFNWEPLLIVMFSTHPIEHRVELVHRVYLSSYTVFWGPLLYSFGLLLLFYFFSSLYLVLFELYGVARRKIEEKFDGLRWSSPADYIRLKESFRIENQRLTKLASDKLDEISDEISRRGDAEKAKAEAELQLQRVIADKSGIERQLAAQAAEQKTLVEQRFARDVDIKNLGKTIVQLKEELSSARNLLMRVQSERPKHPKSGLAALTIEEPGLYRPSIQITDSSDLDESISSFLRATE